MSIRIIKYPKTFRNFRKCCWHINISLSFLLFICKVLFIFSPEKSSLSKNLFDNSVSLSNNTDYICPSDGYFSISCGVYGGAHAQGYVNDVMLLGVTTISTSNTVSGQASSVFVRKGMTLKYTGSTGSSNATFIPLH